MPKLFFSSRDDRPTGGHYGLVLSRWQEGGISPAVFNQEVGQAFLPAATALVERFARAGMEVDATAVWEASRYDDSSGIRVFAVHLGVRVSGDKFEFKGFVLDTKLDSRCLGEGRLRDELSSFLTHANLTFEDMFRSEEGRFGAQVDDFIVQVKKVGYRGWMQEGVAGRRAGYAAFDIPSLAVH